MTKEQENRRDLLAEQDNKQKEADYRSFERNAHISYGRWDVYRSASITYFRNGYNAGFTDGERSGISKVIEFLKNGLPECWCDSNCGETCDACYTDLSIKMAEKNFADVLKEEK